MKKSILIIILIGLVFKSCHNNKKNEIKLSPKQESEPSVIWKSLIVPESDSLNINIYTLKEPVAIAFFNLNKLLSKCDVGRCPDSLPEKLKRPGRQDIYRLTDTWGVFHSIIKPHFDSLTIPITDTIITKGLIGFRIANDNYVINLERFKEEDGILMFNGKDEPIFWTEPLVNDPNKMIDCYYKNNNCP